MAKTKYKIGLVSTERCSLGYQEQLLREGHSIDMVLLYTQAPITEDSGLALKYPKQFRCVNLGQHYLRQSELSGSKMRHDMALLQDTDFVMFDYNRGYTLDAADHMRLLHPNVIAPTLFTNEIENNRVLGKTFAEFCGLKSEAPHYEFTSLEQAIAHVRKTKKNYLLKGEQDTVFPLNWRDCQDFLEQDYFGFIKTDRRVFLEEELHDMFEIAFTVFFNGKDYLDQVLINREYKGMQPDTRGRIFTGESGTVSQIINFHAMPDQIIQAYERAHRSLAKAGYRGPIDMNTLLNHKTGVYNFLEWTCRPGVPTEITLAAIYGDVQSYGSLKAVQSGLTNTHTKVPVRKQAMTVALMHYDPAVQSKAALKIMPLVHGMDKLRKEDGQLKSSGDNEVSVKALLQDSFYQPQADGTLGVRCWGGHDRPVIFIGLHNNLHQGIKRTFEMIARSKIGAWSHTYRDDIGRDLINLDYRAEGLWSFISSVEGKISKGIRDESLVKIAVEHLSLTKEVFNRLLPLEMNSSDDTEMLDQYGDYTKDSNVIILRDQNACEDVGFLVWSRNGKYVYLDNVTTLVERKGLGSLLMKEFLFYHNTHIRLQCQSSLKTYYEKFGFQVYRKANIENRIYMENIA